MPDQAAGVQRARFFPKIIKSRIRTRCFRQDFKNPNQTNDSMSAPTQEQIQSAIAAVGERAAKDQAFREKALKEPVAALNEAGHLDLPLNTPIVFTEKAEEMVLVLPPFGSDPNEITDEEMLGSVSGGATPLFVTLTVLVTVQVATVVTMITSRDKPPIPI
jgi:hypothetical protein